MTKFRMKRKPKEPSKDSVRTMIFAACGSKVSDLIKRLKEEPNATLCYDVHLHICITNEKEYQKKLEKFKHKKDLYDQWVKENETLIKQAAQEEEGKKLLKKIKELGQYKLTIEEEIRLLQSKTSSSIQEEQTQVDNLKERISNRLEDI